MNWVLKKTFPDFFNRQHTVKAVCKVSPMLFAVMLIVGSAMFSPHPLLLSPLYLVSLAPSWALSTPSSVTSQQVLAVCVFPNDQMHSINLSLSRSLCRSLFLSISILSLALSLSLSPPGAGISAVSDPGVGALLQRAGLRAFTRNPQRHTELPRVRRKHPAGLRQVGHAGADAQRLALLQRGEAPPALLSGYPAVPHPFRPTVRLPSMLFERGKSIA